MAQVTVQPGDTLSAIAQKYGVGVSDISGYRSGNPNLIFPGEVLTVGSVVAPTPAPTPSGTPQNATGTTITPGPTVSSIFKNSGGFQDTRSPEEIQLEDLDRSSAQKFILGGGDVPEAERTRIRAEEQQRIQAQITAINTAVAQETARIRQQQGQLKTEELGISGAQSARRGTLGSSFQTGQEGRISEFRAQQESRLVGLAQAQAQQNIQTLMGQADKDATARISERRVALESGAKQFRENLLAEGKKKETQLTSAVKLAIAKGLDISSMTQDQVKELADKYGLNANDVLDILLAESEATKSKQAATKKEALGQKLTQAQIDKINNEITKGNYGEIDAGDRVIIYDKNTGQQVTSFAKGAVPKEEGGGTNGDGQIVDASGKPIKLTASQIDTLSGFKTTIGAATDAIAILDTGISTGPIAGRTFGFKKATGFVDPETLRYEQIIEKVKADFFKAISGAAVSDKEVVRLTKFLPSLTDQENVAKSKLETLISEVKRAQTNYTETLGAVTQTNVRETVINAGYDYDALKAAGHSDEEIIQSITGL